MTMMMMMMKTNKNELKIINRDVIKKTHFEKLSKNWWKTVSNK
jgi:hypothetical protein